MEDFRKVSVDQLLKVDLNEFSVLSYEKDKFVIAPISYAHPEMQHQEQTLDLDENDWIINVAGFKALKGIPKTMQRKNIKYILVSYKSLNLIDTLDYNIVDKAYSLLKNKEVRGMLLLERK